MSLYFFPIELTLLPGINSKMMLAVLGLFLGAFSLHRKGRIEIPVQLLVLVIISGMVSAASLLSVTINQTPDFTYASYLMSACVWLSGSYAVCSFIKMAHGRISVQLVMSYLAVVCMFQCLSALLVDSYSGLKNFLNAHIYFGQDVSEAASRLYGFGSTLDVAGGRFSVVLIGIAFYLAGFTALEGKIGRGFYALAFIWISVVGNMIARTTMVGTSIGLVLLIIGMLSGRGNLREHASFNGWLLMLLLLVIAVSVFLYNTNDSAHKLFRFAFEGFFNLAEKGEWKVSSNEKLKTMIIFPEHLHTWIIGDGYFENSRNDVNYLGNSTKMGFYMGTDIGYLRFIFYFGIIGLIPMVGMILYSAKVCIQSFPAEKWLFLSALLAGLVIWLKVSTDVFMFFSLFLSTAALTTPVSRTGGVIRHLHAIYR